MLKFKPNFQIKVLFQKFYSNKTTYLKKFNLLKIYYIKLK